MGGAGASSVNPAAAARRLQDRPRRPARSQSDISSTRPFYPAGDPTGTKRKHLVDALGLTGNRDLKRRCERSAEALFWLVGPTQVGKAAISGWRDLLAPAWRCRLRWR